MMYGGGVLAIMMVNFKDDDVLAGGGRVEGDGRVGRFLCRGGID